MSVFIVAECGVNWKDMDDAKKMIEVFKVCGADACKFQMYKETHIAGHPRAEELKKILVTPEVAKELKEHGETCNVEVFFTPMYTVAVDELEKLDVNRYKVRNKDATNTAIIRKVCATGKEVMISVANNMLDWNALEDAGYRYKAKLLHCVAKYPADDRDVHFKSVFPALRPYIGSTEYAGYSDHTVGITACITAVAMGAQIVEKHVMLDDGFDWIDKNVSVTPARFKEMVYHIRRAEVLRE